ncbi:unnamed protein product [Symbiodinium sp. CCMP2592]|nr:unnamed protein product [Symbiodinium sp. CCMP2592]
MLQGKQTDKTVASCVCFFPGALSMPHRKTFPGEEIFGGQVGYGFNDEFNYAATQQQRGIVIGMGAFAVENIRTLMEHNSGKFYVIARHHNLLLPRVLSWYVNQTRAPAPAATVLRAMEPMYKYYGKDPWSYYSVQTNADRSVASIKQYTRWGIGDVYFLGVHYGKVETVEGQVKRLKPRTAVITNGLVIENIDHVIKCLGFDCDFGIDRINHTRRHIGFWPDGDFRRWINSDQSSIDASRFGGTAIAPYAAMQAQWGTHFFQFPQKLSADDFINTRMNFTFAGGATLTLSIRFVLSLLSTGEAVLLPNFAQLVTLFADHRRMGLMCASASAEHVYLGYPVSSGGWKSEAAELLLQYLRTYNDITGKCQSLAASPRVRDSAPIFAAFESALKSMQ